MARAVAAVLLWANRTSGGSFRLAGRRGPAAGLARFVTWPRDPPARPALPLYDLDAALVRIHGASRARRPSNSATEADRLGTRPRYAREAGLYAFATHYGSLIARLVLAPGERRRWLARVAATAPHWEVRSRRARSTSASSARRRALQAAALILKGNAPESICGRAARRLLPPGAFLAWRLRPPTRAPTRKRSRCCPACTPPARCSRLCARPAWRRRGRRASSRRAARSWLSERSSLVSGADARVCEHGGVEGGRAPAAVFALGAGAAARRRRQSRPWRRRRGDGVLGVCASRRFWPGPPSDRCWGRRAKADGVTSLFCRNVVFCVLLVLLRC